MNYTIDEKKSNPGRLVLRRRRITEIILSIILMVLGLPFFLAGLLMLTEPGSSAFFFSGIGLLFCSFSFILTTQIKLPENLIFDNITGHLKIKESGSGKEEYTAFSYGEIRNITRRLHNRGESTFHVVELEKKDGAFWTLYQSSSEKKAEKVLAEIKKNVNLEKRGENPKPDGLQRNFLTKREGKSSEVRWKMRKSFSRNILSILVISSFSLMFYGMDSFIESETAYSIGVLFIVAVASLFIFFSFYNTGRIHTVAINSTLLRYSSTGLFSRNRGFNIPLSAIDAVLFNFSTNMLENSIYIMKKSETEVFQRVKRGNIDLMDIKKALLLLLNIKKINTGVLTVREKIELESIIQELIRERTGREGL